MRPVLLAPALLVGLLVAAFQPAGTPSVSSLYGVWEGTLTIRQAGRCSTNGLTQRSEEVRVVIQPGDDGKPQGGFTLMPAVLDNEDNLKIGLKRERIWLQLGKTGVCGRAAPRKYSVKWDGAWPARTDGKRTLQLEGIDEPCPMGGCRFAQTLSLEWKRAVAPSYRIGRSEPLGFGNRHLAAGGAGVHRAGRLE